MRKSILVLIPVNESHKKYLQAQALEADFEFVRPSTVTKEQVQKAHIIIGNPPIEMFQGTRQLEWLQLQSAGADTYAKVEILGQNTLLTNATGAYGLAIAEHMIGMVLMLYKNLHIYRDKQKTGDWSYAGGVKSIYNAKVLVVGAGDIGGEFAKRIKMLGGYTIGIRRTGTDKPEYLDELYHMDKLDELLPQVDIVALSLPSSKETYKLMNRERFDLMKKDAVLINVGRGSTVDTEALVEVLEKGELLGAGLDVTEPEPLPKEHRLWQLENVIITPHVSGGYSLPETLERIVRIAGGNLKAFLNGEELKNVVDFQTGYRKLPNKK